MTEGWTQWQKSWPANFICIPYLRMAANLVLATVEIKAVRRAQYFRSQSQQQQSMTAAVLTLWKLHR